MAGNIQRRPDGRWRARYRDAAQREHARHFDRKRDAERWLASQEVARDRGEWIDPLLAKITVGEWLERWMSTQIQLKPSTLERYRVAIRRQIFPTWQSVPIAHVTHSDVAAWVGKLNASELAPATVRYAYRVFSLSLAAAVRDGRLSRNVAEGVRLPRIVAQQKRFLSHSQVNDLAMAAGQHGILIRVLAYAGLRWGELAALRAGDVDVERRRLNIRRATTEVRGQVIIGTPKTHQVRSVPIPRFLADELAAAVAGMGPEDLVFTQTNGGVLRNTNFRPRVFDPAAKAAGLEGLTPHELRHTAASLAVAAGANVKVVQKMLGHASAAMTLDVYAGLFSDDLDSVGDRLNAAVEMLAADWMRTEPSSDPPPGTPPTSQKPL